MPITRLQHCSALVLFLYFPWFPYLPAAPPEAPPQAVAVETGVTGEPQTATPASEEPLVLPGVVIEEIPKGSALEKAGLQVGDVILSWERLPNPPANPGGASGKIDSPFDWMWLEIEQGPRGMVTLTGERNGFPLSCQIPLGTWAVNVAPNFVHLPASLFRHGKALEIQGDVSSAIAEWRSLAIWFSQQEHTKDEEAWLNIVIGRELAAQGGREEAKSHYLRAIEKAVSDRGRSLTLDLTARFFLENGGSSEAENYFRAALELQTRTGLGELSIARSMSTIVTALYRQGRNSEVAPYLQTAYISYTKLAPQAPELIKILSNLGTQAKQLGNLDQSLKYHQESVNMAETMSPNSIAHADSLYEIGTTERDSGQMKEALVHLLKALELRERLEPGSKHLATTLNGLSMFYRILGDLDQALVLARRSVSISETLTNSEGHTAVALNTIALIENALGQWAEAEADLDRAMMLASKSEQKKRIVPVILANMAVVQENQGRLSAALPIYRKALDLKRRNGVVAEIAPTLRSLGILYYRIGNPAQASAYLSEALAIQESTQPNSIDTADTLDVLAAMLAESGNLAASSAYIEKAIKIVKASAPNSLIAASVYSNYGVIKQRMGLSSVAKQYAQEAVDLYDALFLRVSYSPVALRKFSGRHFSAYTNAAGIYAELGQAELALEATEKGRGRALMMQLAERDLLPSPSVPDQTAEKIRNLEKSLDRLESNDVSTAYNEVDDQKRRSEQHALLRERERLIDEVRRHSPRLAALRYPLALSTDKIQGALDPGTALVSFVTGNTRSLIFTLSRDHDLHVQILPVGEREIRQRVEKFRGLLGEARSGTRLGKLRVAELRRLSKDLYTLLVAPAADRIEESDRVLIVADGPLHYLPFAALVRDAPDEDGHSRDQYLAEWKPFHSVLSATVYAEIKKDREEPTKIQLGIPLLLGAFGNTQLPPDLKSRPPEQVADIRVRSAVRSGTLEFEPLPFSRREVEGIAALFPPEQVAIFLGAEATEEQAKTIGKSVRILHFATHASLDDRFPLNSALVLTMPEGFPENRDNGLLQVWEIFEKMRLNADLVVLSACDSGLGEEQGGEGLIGLTRAFQYAGARTVMASLWSVHDQATSELMIRFYKHLRAGKSKDEALRQAQIELIRGPIEVVNEKGEKTFLDASAPYYWAGFQMYGDWQ
jgi:CHAT domain-containing protein/Tfp pilus assembly protein PilF